LLLTLLVIVLSVSLSAAPVDYEGKTIAWIRFEPSLQPLPDEELATLLPVKAGQPLKLSDLRDAVVRLYATGRYANIAVNAELVNDEVELRFITRNTWFVGSVTVEGVDEPPSLGRLVNATRLQLGRQFTEDAVDRAIENIRTVLHANGLYEAQIQRFVEYQAAFSQVNVLFQITPGQRATLAPPVFVGEIPEESAKLIGKSKWERFWILPGWKTATERRIQRGLERMRKYYQKRDHLMSSVVMEEIRYDPETVSAYPILRVSKGPQLEVQTSGREVSRGRLRKLIPIYQEQSVDRDLLVEGSRNLTEHFQSKGFFDTAVAFQTHQETAQLETVEYAISTGPRYKLVHLEVLNNEYFDLESIHERIAIKPATRIRYRRGRFSEELLQGDLAAITALYRSNGFREVQVTARTESPFQRHDDEIAVFIEIEEGPQWIVSEVDLAGISDSYRAEVESLLSTIPGQPYSESNVARDRDGVLRFYYDNGHLNARFDWEAVQTPDNNSYAVKMRVEEGPKRYVRASLVGGIGGSDPDMVYNRILLQPGDPFDQSAMVETQRRLYDLGVFARVQQAIQNPDGDESRKYLLHQFEEARRYSVNVGVGAQIARIGGGNFTDLENPSGTTGFSPRISLGVTRGNMFGAGHTAGIQTRVSNTRQRALANYLAPQFKGRQDLSLNVTGLYDRSRDINTFESSRLQGSIQLGQRISRANTLRYRFTYRRVDTSKIKIDPELIPIFAQPVRVGLVGFEFVRDRRDDPLNSTRGTYNAIDTAVASRYLGSQTDYFRVIGRNSSYHQIAKDLVIARSSTVGWMANPTDDTPIPLPERIFSGGASSHRAFPDNQAGPRDLETGFPLGGRALLMNNLELRFPLIGESVGGVLFWDAGNVYSTIKDVSLRYRQRDKEDFDYMVHSIGFGIRYSTPIGPIRLDLSFSPNSPRFFGFDGTLEDLINGGGRKIDQRINQFQFFFSIGQTF
jgi:outer membrane protein insertion porin family